MSKRSREDKPSKKEKSAKKKAASEDSKRKPGKGLRQAASKKRPKKSAPSRSAELPQEQKQKQKQTRKLPESAPKSHISPSEGSEEIVPVTEVLPPTLVILPVAQTSLFPGMIVPVIVPEGKLADTIDHVIENSGHIGVVLAHKKEEVGSSPSTHMTGLPLERAEEKDPSVEPGAESLASQVGRSIGVADPDEAELCQYGVMGKVLKKINLPDNQVSVLLTGLHRFRIDQVVSHDPHFVANVTYLLDETEKDVEAEALLRSALSQFKQLSKDNPLISEEVKVALVNIDGPGKLTDLMASVLVRDVENYQSFLSESRVKERIKRLLVILQREQDVQNVQKRIHDEINTKVHSAQREFYLSEQLKAIQKELGQHADEKTRLLDKFKKRLEARKPSQEARTRIQEELEKLETLHEQSSEYSVSLNYLDWATAIPWGLHSEENYSLREARKILDEDHYGLKDVKERILEFLAVKKRKKSSEGSILCFVGPPGTGKTSLGKSIARALGRKFFRFSVGGMRDEAEIKGHRRTYVGAMPGKVIQGVKRVETQNPVFLIDEVDKIGSVYTGGGDPASALLEVLDPEQNKEFLDHYLDIPFDCSNILFIVTANTTDTIPSALLDRTEVIELHGYTDAEKLRIAREYLVPRQLKKNGVKASQCKFTQTGLKYIVSHFAREAGVRNLEKQIAKICRKAAYKVALKSAATLTVQTPAEVEKLLGPPIFTPETSPDLDAPGVATGLAWTQHGGEVLYIESIAVEGKGGIELTGSLGDVMQESANIAYSFVRNSAGDLKLSASNFEKQQIHLHVPAGATPKDGPSAGITMAASLYSLLSERPLPQKTAMTGELTLTGRVLPVGGIKEKLLAAKRYGVRTVLIPNANARDLKEIEKDVLKGLKIVKVGHMREVFRALFPSPRTRKKS